MLGNMSLCVSRPTHAINNVNRQRSAVRVQAFRFDALPALLQMPITSSTSTAPQTATAAAQAAQQAVGLPAGSVDAPIWVVGAG